MTVEHKNFFKMNWLTIANIILLLGIIVQQSKWQQNVDNKINAFDAHIKDTEMHMPFRERIEIFVPRVEIDARLQGIEKTLEKIDSKLK